ncbi:MAG: hypothetical protein AB7G23_14110 [Vicinamibacterales bacterium]
MAFLWIVTITALLAAVAAWSRVRACNRNIEQLSRRYWELKYQQAELRARLDRMPGGAAPAAASEPARPGNARQAFVPISSLKR